MTHVQSDPQVVRSGSTDGVPLGSSGRGRLKVRNQPSGDTGYALVEVSHPAGEPRIRDHVHARHEEAFVVLEGTYRVRLGPDTVVVSTGDYVLVPRGTPHSYRNDGPGAARVLIVISPADGVDLLVELADLAGGTSGEDALAAVHARHSATLVAPLPGW